MVSWAAGWKGGSLACIRDGVGASGKNCNPGASVAEGTCCGVEHLSCPQGKYGACPVVPARCKKYPEN